MLDVNRVVVPASVLEMVPSTLAKKLRILPVAFDGDVLSVATSDPDNLEVLDRIEAVSGCEIEAYQVEDVADLDLALRRYYAEEEVEAGEARATKLLAALLNRAIQMRASDIHVEPSESGGTVRLRIDGQLQRDRALATEAVQELISCVKVLAKLNIAEKRSPLDGSIAMELEGGKVNLRVATIPTIHGERLAMRIMPAGQASSFQDMGSLGLSQTHRTVLHDALRGQHGMLYLSGPTGSGKTTTLYTLLRQLRVGGKQHIVSVEDPVESVLEGVTQIPVDADGNRIRFHKILRSVLRHDPDVILIGETRDGETAEVALNAALTGHLVLSTVHANTAAGVPARLLELGAKPFLLASALQLAIAQRLVRRPCTYCGKEAAPSSEECRRYAWGGGDEVKIIRPVGCSLCGNVGYSGRVGLFEVVPITPRLRELFRGDWSEDTLAHVAYEEEGNPTLQQDGAAKARQGLTTLEELRALDG